MDLLPVEALPDLVPDDVLPDLLLEPLDPLDRPELDEDAPGEELRPPLFDLESLRSPPVPLRVSPSPNAAMPQRLQRIELRCFIGPPEA